MSVILLPIMVLISVAIACTANIHTWELTAKILMHYKT
jgi:hypothetical protein